MALENTDLLVAYRPSDKQHYRVKVEQFNTSGELPDGTSAGQVLTWDGTEWVAADGGGSADLPDGTEAGQILEWNGATWVVATIDGGVYAS